MRKRASTVMISQALLRSGIPMVGSGLVPLLLVLGLLMAPVTCTCGAGVPHGHSLFQLPHHNHAADQNHDDDHVPHSGHGYSHVPHPLIAADLECDEPNSRLFFNGNFALANAMEQQDSAVLQAPSTSSFGQAVAMAQPSLPATMSCEQCEPLNLPGTRTLEGLSPPPETPPPQV
jgi:hypothetical protein